MTTGAEPSGSAPRSGGPFRPVVAGLLAGAVALTTFAQSPNLLQLTGLVLVVLLTTAYEWQKKTGGFKKPFAEILPSVSLD